MHTKYIHSVSRINTLSDLLLSKNDIERLMVAEPGSDLQRALKETYLAPYVARTPGEDVPLAIEQTLIDAKRLIHKIVPDSDLFRVLWVQYDMHNLRVFVKARVKGWDFVACQPYLSERGIYDPFVLYTHATEGTLDTLQPAWQVAYTNALELATAGELPAIDGIFDELYFTTSRRIVDETKDEFMKTYLANLIDLYNLKSRLRHLKNETVSFTPAFIEGGTFTETAIETKETVYARFAKMGPTDFWKDALEYFETTGNFTRIDARAPEYLLGLAKKVSRDLFSSASVVLYYLRCRQAAANTRSIVVGKNSGLTEADIRANLRMAYVND